MHKLLKSTCLSHLGEGDVEERFENGIADVLSGNTVFECLSSPSSTIIKEKINKYTSKEIIFVVPESTDTKVFAQFKCEVWFANVDIGEIILKENYTASYRVNKKKVAEEKFVSYVSRLQNSDIPDAKKMSEVIAYAYCLKKTSISYVAKFVTQKVENEYPDGDYDKAFGEMLEHYRQQVKIRGFRNSIIDKRARDQVNRANARIKKRTLLVRESTCHHYTLTSTLCPTPHTTATSTASSLGGKLN